MKKIRYGVAMSLDGYIAAGPGDNYDWIVKDPEINFAEIFAQYDTLLMGRLTYEVAMTMGREAFGDMKVIVVSRTLRPVDHPGATVISELTRDWLRNLRSQQGKDIWLFGGCQLARAVLELGELDAIDVSVIPVILGGGISLIGGPVPQTKLKLTSHKIYKSGIASLKYDVLRG